MASINRPFRPEMDWTVDADLPHRFKIWKRQVKNEIQLQMAQDSNKGETYACMFVLVSAGEQGEDVIAKGGLSGESKNYTKLIKCLEESVTPSAHYMEDCINYFFCKQCNLLFVGLKDKNVLKDCQKFQQKDCTVESIIDLALQAEFREATNARISKTINSSHQSMHGRLRTSAVTSTYSMASINRPFRPEMDWTRKSHVQVCTLGCLQKVFIHITPVLHSATCPEIKVAKADKVTSNINTNII
ncbi:hypothetical protein CAPTEDRAFT_186299 [Capitella teleta]|uniref:Uncharacterized protein n=1 Tax=Capitella teleta TaxID=283909 RepID=R7T783_CAPTE|nr:hypothetical protein CAPTEDRAFT_186299 [Capitella teleta]|eukprot:ELT87250.1 hypothetical protein CAPTEDRAFT_186299 [Capitella teleta]